MTEVHSDAVGVSIPGGYGATELPLLTPASLGCGHVAGEQGPALIDDVLANIRHLKKCFHEGLTIKSLALAEDYRQGRLEFAVELNAVCHGDAGVVDVCRARLKIRSSETVFGPRDLNGQAVNLEVRNRWNEQFVFVENVQIVEGPEGVLPSIVGLQLIDDAKPLGVGPLHFTLSSFALRGGPAVAGFYEFLQICPGREISAIGLSSADRGDREGVGDVVKGRAEIMYCVASGHGELQGQGLDRIRYDLHLPLIRLGADKEIDVSFVDDPGGGSKFLKVSFGPFNL